MHTCNRSTTPADTRPSSRGVLTFAVGAKRYIDQAVNLARSVRLHNPGLPVALVTDSRSEALAQEFAHILPLQPDLGAPLRQKLYSINYSPFDETLFIDSDCLVFGSLDGVFAKLEFADFNMAVAQLSHGTWHSADLSKWAERLGTATVPVGNAGCFFFRRSPDATNLFAAAREAMNAETYRQIGVHNRRDGELMMEPAISVAMVQCGFAGVPLDYSIMVSPLTPRGKLCRFDVLSGRLEYAIADERVEPAIYHFLAGAWMKHEYRREAAKLRLVFERGLPAWLVAAMAFVQWDVPHAVVERTKQLARPFKRWLLGPPHQKRCSGAEKPAGWQI